MASTAWYEIYQSYSHRELEDEIEKLKKRNTGFSAQSMPSGKSYTAALDELREQLAAAIRVREDRTGRPQPRVLLTDFSTFGADYPCRGMASQVLGEVTDEFKAYLGDGTNSQFPVNHGMRSKSLFAVVRENMPNGRMLDSTEYAIIFNSPLMLTIYFASAPTFQQYVLTLSKGGC